jgi:hypothetical protein
VVVEEADETLYWLELLHESNLIKPERLFDLLNEANETVAISVAARKTAKQAARAPASNLRVQSSIDNRQSTIL